MLLLAVTTKILHKDRLTRLGPEGWAQKDRYAGTGLVGRTLGVVGLGSIAAELVRLATAARFEVHRLRPLRRPQGGQRPRGARWSTTSTS